MKGSNKKKNNHYSLNMKINSQMTSNITVFI